METLQSESVVMKKINRTTHSRYIRFWLDIPAFGSIYPLLARCIRFWKWPFASYGVVKVFLCRIK